MMSWILRFNLSWITPVTLTRTRLPRHLTALKSLDQFPLPERSKIRSAEPESTRLHTIHYSTIMSPTFFSTDDGDIILRA